MKNKMFKLFISTLILMGGFIWMPQSILAESLSDNEIELTLENEEITNDGSIRSGKYNNISWILDSEGKLVLTGSGIIEQCNQGEGWRPFLDDIKTIEIGEGITGIGELAFSNVDKSEFGDYSNLQIHLQIQKVTIPNSIEKIERGAFSGCYIQHLYYASTKKAFLTSEWEYSRLSLYDIVSDDVKNIHCCDGDILESAPYRYILLEDGTIEIIDCFGDASNDKDNNVITFPSEINGICVTSIGGGTRLGVEYWISDVIIPNTVKHIGAYAFYNRPYLANVTFPEGLESIGEWAFCWDYKMSPSIKLPRSIKEIGDNAFSENWDLTDIYYAGTKAEWKCIHNLGNFYNFNLIIHCLDGKMTKQLEDILDDMEKDFPEGPDTWRDKEGIEGFVYRLYNIALLRDAEDAGLEDWMNRLQSGEENAAEVARGIFFSDEFLQRDYTDEQYVEFLYRTLFGRKSDAAGKENWLNCLENGVSREFVYHGFAESEEFTVLCDDFGVSRGEVDLEQYRDKNAEATGFIARLYTKMLGRKFDEGGLEDWCKAYITKEKTIENIAADGFLHSPEFEQQNLDNKEFVTRMYETFLNREPDEAGLNDWIGRLERGEETRDSLVYGFTNSPEFAKLKAEYNLP